MSLSVAIVGSGPAGLYAAEAILRASPGAQIDVLDRLPTPFGLVRSGVAPDHQTTKAVARVLDRVLARPEVAFFGGVELGRDVELDVLRSAYDALVIATGASLDRTLDVPGADLPGVATSGRFVGWYNGHPDHGDVEVAGVRTAIAIGSGNVALDVARILAKTVDEFSGSDLAPDVSHALAAWALERIHVIGRSPAAAMKFTEAEVLEFGALERARPQLGLGGNLAGLDTKPAAALRAIVANAGACKPVDVVFEFGLTPVAFEGEGRLERVRFVAADGTAVVRVAQLAVTCIGYASHGHALPRANGALANEDGRVTDGIYVVGWAKRGASGTIPTNRVEAQAVAKKLVAETASGGKPGRAALRAALADCTPVDYAAWRRIDASEIARADAARARRKWRSIAELTAAASLPRRERD